MGWPPASFTILHVGESLPNWNLRASNLLSSLVRDLGCGRFIHPSLPDLRWRYCTRYLRTSLALRIDLSPLSICRSAQISVRPTLVVLGYSQYCINNFFQSTSSSPRHPRKDRRQSWGLHNRTILFRTCEPMVRVAETYNYPDSPGRRELGAALLGTRLDAGLVGHNVWDSNTGPFRISESHETVHIEWECLHNAT